MMHGQPNIKIFYNIFIWILYMFRTNLYSSSGRQLY